MELTVGVSMNFQKTLGLFGRWGQAPSETSVIRCFWSLGAQYQGLLPS